MVKAGQDIDARCNKCKLVLAHVVIAVDGTRIARVQCKTCSGVHAYRDPSPKKRPSAATTGGRKTASNKKPAAPTASDYDNLMTGLDLSRARRYRISESFGEGDVLDHKTFGLGLVTRLLDDHKIEAVFRDGSKVLAHGHQPGA